MSSRTGAGGARPAGGPRGLESPAARKTPSWAEGVMWAEPQSRGSLVRGAASSPRPASATPADRHSQTRMSPSGKPTCPRRPPRRRRSPASLSRPAHRSTSHRSASKPPCSRWRHLMKPRTSMSRSPWSRIRVLSSRLPWTPSRLSQPNRSNRSPNRRQPRSPLLPLSTRPQWLRPFLPRATRARHRLSPSLPSDQTRCPRRKHRRALGALRAAGRAGEGCATRAAKRSGS